MATEKFPPAQQQVVPQATFTKEELDGLVEFYNLICNRAKFEFSMAESCKASNLLSHFKRHLDKVNDHILEVVRVTKAPATKGE
jgi:hypothetical protein